MPGPFRKGHVHREIVHLFNQITEVQESDPQILCHLRRHQGVMAQNPHAQADGPGSDLPSDLAQTDDAQSLAVEFRTPIGLSLPAALPKALRSKGDSPGQGHHQGDGVLRCSDGIATGDVHHDHPGPGRSSEIHVIHPGPGPADDPEIGPPVQELSSYLGAAPDEQSMEPWEPLQELLRGDTSSVHDLYASFPERPQLGRIEGVGNNYTQGDIGHGEILGCPEARIKVKSPDVLRRRVLVHHRTC